jgi:hypothetical protein
MGLIAAATIKPNKLSLKVILRALPEKKGIEVPNKK